MIAKIVSGHGTGSAAPAIHYIAGEKDHKGNKRDEVVHLFGDGQQVIDLTESMTCKHTYLSSVLSFTQEESSRLSLDDIQQLAESFAAHHAHPMGVQSIAGCAYLHIEDGRYDVHVVQARFDLESGKRVDLYLDICGDTHRIADWQDCKNYEMKMDDPRDPSRMRLTHDHVRESKNHSEVLKEFERQSRHASRDIKIIIDSNMKQLNRGLQHQTKGALNDFQKSFRLILQRGLKEYSQEIRKIQLLILIPLGLSCLMLAGVGFWATQKANTLIRLATVANYPTQPYQGTNYAIVPQANVLQYKHGNYWIKLK